MNIINKKISDLIPYEFNTKEHPTDQIDKIAISIKKYGFLQPLVIDSTNTIVVGHGRIEAAKKLSIEEVPCVLAENLTDEQLREYRILDNKLNESEWIMENLKIELETLTDLREEFEDLKIEFENQTEQMEVNDKEIIRVFVDCENEEKQEIVFEYLKEGGFNAKIINI